MKQIIDYYVTYLTREGLDKERTVNKYISCINEFIEDMEIKSVEDINKLGWVDIRTRYLKSDKNIKLSPQSINLRITSLKSFFTFLEGTRYIDRNVCKDLKKETVKHKKVKVDEQVVADMIDKLNKEVEVKGDYLSHRNRLMVFFGLFMGMRNEEMRNIQLGDINIFNEGRFMTRESKFDKSRELMLPEKLFKMYNEYLEIRIKLPTDDTSLFVSKNYKQMNKNTPRDVLKKYCDNYTYHDLRHIFATISLDSGSTLEDVSKTLGHSNVRVTSQVYAEVSESRLNKTINNNRMLDII